MAFSYSPKIVTDGLVLYLDAANPYSYVSGSTTWNDLSRSTITGTLTNGPIFNTGSGGNIVFDGVNDFISIPDNAVLDPTTLTFSTWLNPNVTSSRSSEIFVHGDNINGWYLELGTLTPILFVGATNRSTLVALTNNTWQFLTVTYDGANIRIYINNTLRNTAALSTPITRYTGSARLGDWIGGGYAYPGRIATAQLYNRVLTLTEIQQNYNTQKSRFGL